MNPNQLGADLASILSTAAHNQTGTNENPDYAVTLQRGHGFTTWGTSLQDVMYRPICTRKNANVQMTAREFSVASDLSSTIPSTRRETADWLAMNEERAYTSWAYWSQIKEPTSMYKNELSNYRNTKQKMNYLSTTEGQTVAKG